MFGCWPLPLGATSPQLLFNRPEALSSRSLERLLNETLEPLQEDVNDWSTPDSEHLIKTNIEVIAVS